jgi:hypothetical protein
LLSRKSVDYHGVFDLGAKMHPTVGEWFKHYDFTKNSRRRYANSIAQYLETIPETPVVFGASHVAFKNTSPGAARKKILIFGDSFSAQGMTSLTGTLAETASEVEFVGLRVSIGAISSVPGRTSSYMKWRSGYCGICHRTTSVSACCFGSRVGRASGISSRRSRPG